MLFPMPSLPLAPQSYPPLVPLPVPLLESSIEALPVPLLESSIEALPVLLLESSIETLPVPLLESPIVMIYLPMTAPTLAPSAVPTSLPMSSMVTQPMLAPNFSPMPLPFVPWFAPTPLLLSAPDALSSYAPLLLPLLSSTPWVIPMLLSTAAYSIAASADSSAAATAATTAAQSAICVDVRVTCRAKSSFAARAVASAAVRVCRVEFCPLAVKVECRPRAAVTVARTRSLLCSA